jgi:small neutral amino acid transporter SnatA (MarC family)
MRAFLLLLVAVNPAAVAAGRQARAGLVLAFAAAVTAVAAIAFAGVSGPILDALDVSPATFRLAAGAVLAAGSLWWVVVGRAPVAGPGEPDRGGALLVLDLAILLSPQLVAVSIALGADDGVGVVAVGAPVVLAVTWLVTALAPDRPAVWSAVARVVGAFGVVLALDLVVDGVKSV